MQCEEVREQFTDYVVNQIDESARSRVAQHLMSCEACRTETEELRTLWNGLGAIPASEPGPELRARFNVMLEAYRHGLDQASAKSWWSDINTWIGAWWPRQPVLQLALTVGLLVLGLAIGRQFQSPATTSGIQPKNEVTDLRDELAQMRRM